jgi:hypothetical protein|tara:strand:+ start:115 stop:579 length:465 start_codon:yes stop_codon:yes gene_type:complete
MPIDASEAQALEPNEYGLIDLDKYTNDNFTLFGYSLSQVLDDIILIQYADLGDETGQTVVRNGIAIPLAHVERAWRIGKIVLAGPRCNYVAVGDYVCFPSDKGIPCNNLNVVGTGILKDATFLNEGRIFGICKPVKLNKNDANKSKRTTKRSTE